MGGGTKNYIHPPLSTGKAETTVALGTDQSDLKAFSSRDAACLECERAEVVEVGSGGEEVGEDVPRQPQLRHPTRMNTATDTCGISLDSVDYYY